MANDTKKPDPNLGADERAAARRSQEAEARAKASEAEVDKQLDDAKARVASDRAQDAAKAKVDAARASLQAKAEAARKSLEAQKAKLKVIEAAIGDATGAIITAGDVSRIDAVRALAGMDRATAAFDAAVK